MEISVRTHIHTVGRRIITMHLKEVMAIMRRIVWFVVIKKIRFLNTLKMTWTLKCWRSSSEIFEKVN